MATVYLAQDPKHDRHVAIKILRPELAAVIGAELAEDSEDLEAFEGRAGEPSLSFADVLKEMRQTGEL